MANILTAAEAALVLRCSASDTVMLSLLPAVDEYIHLASGHDWAGDSTIHNSAKAAARILITLWYENPGMIGQGVSSLGAGLTAVIVHLQALALRYHVFEGLTGSGYVAVPAAQEGDTVSEVIGVVGVTGSQADKFETVVSETGYIRQVSASDLSGKYYRALVVPPE